MSSGTELRPRCERTGTRCRSGGDRKLHRLSLGGKLASGTGESSRINADRIFKSVISYINIYRCLILPHTGTEAVPFSTRVGRSGTTIPALGICIVYFPKDSVVAGERGRSKTDHARGQLVGAGLALRPNILLLHRPRLPGSQPPGAWYTLFYLVRNQKSARATWRKSLDCSCTE